MTCSTGDSGRCRGDDGGVDGVCTGDVLVSVGAGEGNFLASGSRFLGALDVDGCDRFGGGGDGTTPRGSSGIESLLGFLRGTGDGTLRTGGGGVSVFGGSGVRTGGSSSITSPGLGSFLISLVFGSFFTEVTDGDAGLVSEICGVVFFITLQNY